MPGLIGATLLIGLCLVLWLNRPDSAINRRLAMLLFLEGTVTLTLNGGTFLVESAQAAWALAGVGYVAVWIKTWAYYHFLSSLPVPMARRMARPLPRIILAGFTVFAVATWFIWPTFYVGSVVPGPNNIGWAAMPGAGLMIGMIFWSIVFLAAIGFSIAALRRAATETTRQVAKAFVISFGFRDTMFAATTAALLIAGPTSSLVPAIMLLIPITYSIYPVLLGFGLLKYQVFDIDVKLRFVIKQSTLVGVATVVFLVLGELLENVVQDVAGQAISLATAVGLAFVVKPVRTLADRLAHRAVPAKDLDAQRLLVYRAALEGAWEDGGVDLDESRMLARLRSQLGLSDTEAKRVTSEVLQQPRLVA